MLTIHHDNSIDAWKPNICSPPLSLQHPHLCLPSGEPGLKLSQQFIQISFMLAWLFAPQMWAAYSALQRVLPVAHIVLVQRVWRLQMEMVLARGAPYAPPLHLCLTVPARGHSTCCQVVL